MPHEIQIIELTPNKGTRKYVILTELFSYEKSSNFSAGTTPALFHSVIPLPALRRVGTHPVKIVLQRYGKASELHASKEILSSPIL